MRKIILFLLFAASFSSAEITVFDTGIHEEIAFLPFKNLMKSHGQTIKYCSLILSEEDRIHLTNTNIILLSEELMRAVENKTASPTLEKVARIITKATQTPGIITILVFPHDFFNKTTPEEIAERNIALQEQLRQLGLDQLCAEPFFTASKTIFDNGVPFRGRRWETSLYAPSIRPALHLPSIIPEQESAISIFTLPCTEIEESEETDMFRILEPLGVGFFSKETNYTTIIASPAVLPTLLDDFTIRPVFKKDKMHFESKIKCFWKDVFSAFSTTDSPKESLITKTSERRGSYTEPSSHSAETVGCTGEALETCEKTILKPTIKIAWSQLTDLIAKTERNKIPEDSPTLEAEMSTALDNDFFSEETRINESNFIDNMLKGKFTHIWINDSPQMYYGKHQRKTSQERHLFEQQLKRISEEIMFKARTSSIQPPQLFIGFELVNHINGDAAHREALVENPAIDIYQTTYKDTPSLCDEDFWQSVVIEPLIEFCRFYYSIPAENRLPIAGPFIDFELYLRAYPPVGEFAGTMLHDKKLLARFFAENPHLLEHANIHDPLFLSTLQHYAETYLKSFFKDRLQKAFVDLFGPEYSLGMYTMQLTTDWLYKSFIQGAANSIQPVYWCTFNTTSLPAEDFHSTFKHAEINHLPVFMLSKLSASHAANLFKLQETVSLYPNITGCWFNRATRFDTPYDGVKREWFFLEQPGEGFTIKTKDSFLSAIA